MPSFFETWDEAAKAKPAFDGATFEPEKDHDRLSKQLQSVLALMSDGEWRTLEQIGEVVGCPPQSASARVRDLRKPKFGGHQVERRRVSGGLFQYRIVVESKEE